MSSFWLYFTLGFDHVLDLEGLDHFFFLIVLALPFSWRKLKSLVGWVTLFTIGHTFSLCAAYNSWIKISGVWIEFLIPITIAWMAIRILLPEGKSTFHSKLNLNVSLTTLVFGLIHGLGFGRYFSQIVLEDAAYTSLFQFALGVEFAQLLIVFGVVVANLFIVDIFRWNTKKWRVIISAMVLSQALKMAFENNPWT